LSALSRLNRYRRALDQSLAFWRTHSLDREYGGYFTCLTREGRVYDSRKYVWLMGRAAWMFAKLGYPEESKLIGEFVRRHARDDHGRYWFALERDGRKAIFQRKPYAAVFVCLALNALGYREEAVASFWQIRKWIADPTLLGRPALAHTQLADAMVTISMLLELEIAPELLAAQVDLAFEHLHPELGVFVENRGIPEDLPPGRLWCPGHSMEVAWFLYRALEKLGDTRRNALATESIGNALTHGWDEEMGGLFYFRDTRGLPLLELEADMKLWWPHTEAMLALAHAWRRTRDPRWLAWLDRFDEYSWRVFVDEEYGEWFGYASREGRVTHRAKGNHYKGFFHVPRALHYAIEEISAVESKA
jgi:N-acylglucosamine 2-epimerase